MKRPIDPEHLEDGDLDRLVADQLDEDARGSADLAAEMRRKMLAPGGLEAMVGTLLDAVGDDSDRRKQAIVKMAREAAGRLPTRCSKTALVNRELTRCIMPNGHVAGACEFRTTDPTIRKPSQDAEEDLDGLLEWSPEPGPILDEILSILAKLPPLPEIDRIVELAGKLAGMVR